MTEFFTRAATAIGLVCCIFISSMAQAAPIVVDEIRSYILSGCKGDAPMTPINLSLYWSHDGSSLSTETLKPLIDRAIQEGAMCLSPSCTSDYQVRCRGGWGDCSSYLVRIAPEKIEIAGQSAFVIGYVESLKKETGYFEFGLYIRVKELQSLVAILSAAFESVDFIGQEYVEPTISITHLFNDEFYISCRIDL